MNILMNFQHYHNALKTRKTVAVFFKDVENEETISSQGQKLVETTNLWQLFWDKNSPAQIRGAMITATIELNKWSKMSTSKW